MNVLEAIETRREITSFGQR
ncbi:Protein of unknown function [Thermobacillus xylanilyticus]|uniref:Uncharacterized protein n=1 Tax=Thermobacillus xylanilyticus TaxID=76633 RepID=A0ABM8V7Q6_THEXY|nr:Protein of unknown function [Thermobacillus xylanilyticus]